MLNNGLVHGSNHTKSLLLLTYILMNTVRNYPIIHLQLNWIDVLEVVVLLMTYLIKFVFQMKQKIPI